ncbi:WXG100 family type VII secretion target [Micromonospora lupini]|uniref:WXG100 family type VII secretion target n=1 Tax=Micromonospora lupini TaxID=285679 RepID=UPI0031D1EAF8
MADYMINTVEAEAQMQQLVAVRQRLEEMLNQLSSSVQTYNTNNAGRAIESYDHAQRLWNQGLQEFGQGVQKAASNLGQITNGYTDADNRGQSFFAQ